MILALLLAQAAPAAEPACTDTGFLRRSPLAGWTRRGATLDSGDAVTMATVEPASVRMVGIPAPTKPGRALAIGFSVRAAGSYGLALDQKGWIDVYPEPSAGRSTALASTTHGHGPACSTIRKIVRYTLAPGRYRILVSGLEQPMAKLMLVRNPS